MDKIATSKFNTHLYKNSGFHEVNTSEGYYMDFFQQNIYSLMEKELIDPPGPAVLQILDISKRTREI